MVISNLTWFRLCCLCLSREYYAIDTIQDGFRKLKAKILEKNTTQLAKYPRVFYV